MNVVYILKNLKGLNDSKDQCLNDSFPLLMSSSIEKVTVILPYPVELRSDIIARLAFRCDPLYIDSSPFTEIKQIKTSEFQYSKNVKIYLLKPENYNFFLPDNKIEDDISLFSLSALKLINTYINDSDIIHIVDNSAILFPVYYKTGALSSSKIIYNFNKLDDDFLLPSSFIDRYNLKHEDFNPNCFEYYGSISFLKSAIYYSDAITSSNIFEDNEQQDGRIQYLLKNRNNFFNIISAIDDISLKNKYLNGQDKLNKKLNMQNSIGLDIGKTLWFIENMDSLETSQYIFELLSNHLTIYDDEIIMLKQNHNNEILYKLKNKFPARVSIIENHDSEIVNIIAAADFLLLNNNSNKFNELCKLAVSLGTVVVGICENSELLRPLEPNLRIGNSITSSDINDLPLLLKKGSFFSKKESFLQLQKRLLDRTNNCKLMTGKYKNLYKKLKTI